MPVIHTNLSSMTARRHLNDSTNGLNKVFERLSSGLRINRSADDASGLAIATRMQSQIMGINRGMMNANDGLSLGQISDGVIQQATNNVQRIRELAVKASNETNTATDRDDILLEVNQLKEDLNALSTQPIFNGQVLFDGTHKELVFQVGAGSGDQVTMTIERSLSASVLGVEEAETTEETVDEEDGDTVSSGTPEPKALPLSPIQILVASHMCKAKSGRIASPLKRTMAGSTPMPPPSSRSFWNQSKQVFKITRICSAHELPATWQPPPGLSGLFSNP